MTAAQCMSYTGFQVFWLFIPSVVLFDGIFYSTVKTLKSKKVEYVFYVDTVYIKTLTSHEVIVFTGESWNLTCRPVHQQSVSVCTCPWLVGSGNIYCPWAGWWQKPEREEEGGKNETCWIYSMYLESVSNFHKFQPFNPTLPKNTPKQPRTHEDLMLGPQ